MERVGRAEIAPQLAPGAGIGEELDVAFCADAPVAAAFGTDVERLFDFLPQVDVPAAVTLFPRVRRNLQPLALRRPGLPSLPKPCHHGHRCRGRSGRGARRVSRSPAIAAIPAPSARAWRLTSCQISG